FGVGLVGEPAASAAGCAYPAADAAGSPGPLHPREIRSNIRAATVRERRAAPLPDGRGSLQAAVSTHHRAPAPGAAPGAACFFGRAIIRSARRVSTSLVTSGG